MRLPERKALKTDYGRRYVTAMSAHQSVRHDVDCGEIPTHTEVMLTSPEVSFLTLSKYPIVYLMLLLFLFDVAKTHLPFKKKLDSNNDQSAYTYRLTVLFQTANPLYAVIRYSQNFMRFRSSKNVSQKQHLYDSTLVQIFY